SVKPPDKEHPYGHGKLETFAMVVVAAFLVLAALVIAVQSLHEIRMPHEAPAWFTLPVLALVVIVKFIVSAVICRSGREYGSSAMEADAWHHLSDAIPS